MIVSLWKRSNVSVLTIKTVHCLASNCLPSHISRFWFLVLIKVPPVLLLAFHHSALLPSSLYTGWLYNGTLQRSWLHDSAGYHYGCRFIDSEQPSSVDSSRQGTQCVSQRNTNNTTHGTETLNPRSCWRFPFYLDFSNKEWFAYYKARRPKNQSGWNALNWQFKNHLFHPLLVIVNLLLRDT